MVIYGAGLLAVGVVEFAICWWIRGESDRSDLAGSTPPELGPYEVAMLQGGDALVLTAAACRLKEMGSIAPRGAPGGLTVIGEPPPSPEPVESWMYSVVRGAPGSSKEVLDEGAAEVVLWRIRERLRALGLMIGERQRSLIRRQLWWFAPVLALGVARVFAGVQNHRPVLGLIVLIVIGGYGAVVITKPPLTTLAGRRLLKRLRKDSSALGSYGSVADVALNGVSALWAADATLATALGRS
jgi:uncharacterized protein (TIGR04222 family)